MLITIGIHSNFEASVSNLVVGKTTETNDEYRIQPVASFQLSNLLGALKTVHHWHL